MLGKWGRERELPVSQIFWLTSLECGLGGGGESRLWAEAGDGVWEKVQAPDWRGLQSGSRN